MKIKRYIPKPFKYILIALYITGRLILRGSPVKEPRLNLAEVLPPPGSTKIVHGGKVKLLHLRERFGDTWKRFNIAYLVSSGLPFAPSIWLKLYKLFDIKVVWNQNGVAYPALYPAEVVENINSLLKPIHLSDYVVHQTEFVKRCADKYLGVFQGLSQVIINPVDIDEFQPRETPLSKNPLVLMTSGNHHESKERMLVTLETIKALHDKGLETKLIILGDLSRNPNGLGEQELDEKIASLGLEKWIEKKGHFLQKDAPSLYHQAHIFLHLKYLDPCPTFILEALASGVPVVASASGGLPEMVDKRAGVLIPIVEDFEKLHYPSVDETVSAIEKVAADLDTYSHGARVGAVNKFDNKTWLEKHREIFDSILS